MTPPLRDRVLVIIGGTTGLGLSAAKACVEAGAQVIAVGRNPEHVGLAQEVLGEAGRALEGDATAAGTAERAITEALATLGGFHGLYHVAGGSGRRAGDGPLHELSDAGWEATLELNLTSLMRSNRAAVRQFLAQKTGGSILNMGSVLATRPSPQFFATHAYAAAKAAIAGFSVSLASYYAAAGIRVNVLAPGLVETPMAQRAVNDQEIQRFICRKQPLDGGRVGQPSDLDAAAVFFLSEAAKFCTGQVLHVDGGWSVTEGRMEGERQKAEGEGETLTGRGDGPAGKEIEE